MRFLSKPDDDNVCMAGVVGLESGFRPGPMWVVLRV